MDTGWLIYNKMLDVMNPLKPLWFPVMVTIIYTDARVEIAEDKERVKDGMTNSAKSLEELLQFGDTKSLLKYLMN